MAQQMTVKTPEGAYPITIGRGLLRSLDPAVYKLDRRAAVITNTTLATLYGEALARSLPDAALIIVPDGEQYKTLDTAAGLYADLVSAGIDRHSVAIALGGGVLGDTAGFAAATYMRGIPFVQIPTTLLAMVDSSVGGKVGVDLPQGKNLVGAFKQPEWVIIDIDVLETLPEREWRCGMAEVIKHGLLADPVLLDLAPDYRQHVRAIVQRAIQVKVNVVQTDPYEHGIRAHLNLGHTFAHAIEQVSGYQWLHGEAVGVGLVAAALLSSQLGMCSPDLPEQVEGLVGGIGLPTRISALDPNAIYAAMATDKKWRAGKSRFILLEGIGKPRIVENVAQSEVIAVLRSLAG